ncbi:MAG: hypothetical protein PUG78_09895 [Eubacteriales bacterium]|nr:hypothetical protein [Eubacteriales bacterium]MDY2934128.1 hypothetical protein [Anaerovoracaceae bacterium]
MVLSRPSLAAAKQHMTSPNTSRSRLLLPQHWISALVNYSDL